MQGLFLCKTLHQAPEARDLLLVIHTVQLHVHSKGNASRAHQVSSDKHSSSSILQPWQTHCFPCSQLLLGPSEGRGRVLLTILLGTRVYVEEDYCTPLSQVK